MEFVLLVILFFLIAVIYASVGFGGGSSYLALLAQPLFLFTPESIRPTALLCNLIVVGGSIIIFYRERLLIWKRFWPFLVASVPAAYLGGWWKLSDQFFFVILGVTLVAASLFLWIQPRQEERAGKDSWIRNMMLGGGIGFLSGLVGIGGGIFLAPLLHLMHWGRARTIAALASVFIFVNSISGLLGQFQSGLNLWNHQAILPLLMAVFVGGQLGARLGARQWNPVIIKRITAGLILLAAINILQTHL
jgi:uncharacterized protein